MIIKANSKDIGLRKNIHANLPHWIMTDPTKLRQVLINLLNNAIKFTDKGHVELNVGYKEIDETKLTINVTIKDTGIGIESSAINHLFQPFAQAESSTTRRFGGTGLGLAICKSIVEMMDGKLTVESIAGEGSTFSFYFTAEKTTSQSVNELKNDKVLDTQLAQNFPRKILVAEDNEINRNVFNQFLEILGYKADFAHNGIEVLEMLKSKNYDIIFMDCHMPEMDGYEATKNIIDTYQHNRPEIIALTASAMKEDRDKCFEAGMDKFL